MYIPTPFFKFKKEKKEKPHQKVMIKELATEICIIFFIWKLKQYKEDNIAIYRLNIVIVAFTIFFKVINWLVGRRISYSLSVHNKSRNVIIMDFIHTNSSIFGNTRQRLTLTTSATCEFCNIMPDSPEHQLFNSSQTKSYTSDDFEDYFQQDYVPI